MNRRGRLAALEKAQGSGEPFLWMAGWDETNEAARTRIPEGRADGKVVHFVRFKGLDAPRPLVAK